MILKEADGRADDIKALEGLLEHPDASAEVKDKIALQIKKIKSGVKGEKDIAYELDFHMGKSENYAVIHDLRLEVDGRVAQIDHLVIGRFFDIWVCESKRYAEGISVNESGEFTVFYQGKPKGIPSPVEQNKKHEAVISDLFKTKRATLPSKLGMSFDPDFHSYIVVSSNARISRPSSSKAGDLIVKTDQLGSRISDDYGKSATAFRVGRVIGLGTMESIGRQIIAAHTPIEFDWYGKFGLKKIEEKPVILEEKKAGKAAVKCDDCSEDVDGKVAFFCRVANKAKFKGKVYCRNCQKNH